MVHNTFQEQNLFKFHCVLLLQPASVPMYVHAHVLQVNEKIGNSEREYRDCIKADETRLGSQGIS